MTGRDTIEERTSVGVAEAAAPVAVVVLDGGKPTRRVLAVTATGIVLGRSGEPGVDIGVDDDLVSRRHAQVRWQNGMFRVVDLGSRNGTSLDGHAITGDVRVGGDGVIRIGRSLVLLVRDGRGHDAPPADSAMVVGPELARALAAVRGAASSPALLVLGESGTGKEAAARAYHDAGPRGGGPLVAVNCATIAASVAERLLFGARRGAYSGATDAGGFVQSAAGGTLFLDEIAELDLTVQAKLLRVIETREVIPVGSTTGTVVELGLVAATHTDLEKHVAAGRFRADLYYRIARPTVVLPPLRARRSDIPRLVARALAEVSPALTAHPRMLEAACLRPWPGNVRELLHAVRVAATAAIDAGRDVVRPEDLAGGEPLTNAAPIAAAEDASPVTPASPATPTGPTTPPPDHARIVAAIEAAGGNLSSAARALGLHRTQLYRLMEKLGIRREP